ncbi:MAG: SDR family oxidoreductase [Gammaproteobacteria bacterium]|jgi:NAD(P)-dependent dehydrogenase (short-subunit alcohol dehydrogenase family)|nr:SDR family oxidoreductase [Gammaproteobacteria bacterium]
MPNKNILISAAADGIGWTIAKSCLEKGYSVYLSDINQQKIDEIKDHPLINNKIFIDNVDANNPDSIEKYFDSIKEKTTTIDALINNVGIAGPTGPMESLSISDWKRTIEVNINGHFYFTKHAIPLLKANNGGSIINISSTAGLFGFPLRTAYAASKWAVIGITKSLAMELGDFNVRVNAICPGSVAGDRMKRVIEAKAKSIGVPEEELQQDYESMVSLKTFVDKEDIASMALFLISNKAKRISGQVMTVDGNTERMS